MHSLELPVHRPNCCGMVELFPASSVDRGKPNKMGCGNIARHNGVLYRYWANRDRTRENSATGIHSLQPISHYNPLVTVEGIHSATLNPAHGTRTRWKSCILRSRSNESPLDHSQIGCALFGNCCPKQVTRRDDNSI